MHRDCIEWSDNLIITKVLKSNLPVLHYIRML